MNITQDDIYDYGLHVINDILHDSGHMLSKFLGMPLPLQNWSNTISNRLISQQINYDS